MVRANSKDLTTQPTSYSLRFLHFDHTMSNSEIADQMQSNANYAMTSPSSCDNHFLIAI